MHFYDCSHIMIMNQNDGFQKASCNLLSFKFYYCACLLTSFLLTPAILIGQAVDSIPESKKPLEWNEFDLGFTTLKFGAGFLYEYAGFSQNEEGKEQMDSLNLVLENKFKTRDLRFLVSGQIKSKRYISWKLGYMYDGLNEEWLFRETGIIVGVPEISSQFFIGRTKEGYSLSKVMSGYAVWTFERQMSTDVIQILGDGVRWSGFLPKSKIFWNLGAFTDVLSHEQGYSKYNWQFILRTGWLPVYNEINHSLVHLGINLRYGNPEDGKMRLRSKPEADPAPYFIDTGDFLSENSSHIGGEVYYQKKSFLVGSEFNLHSFNSPSTNDPKFFGADILFAYTLTGENRPYNSTGSIFGFMPVEKSIFKGGTGAWEAVLRISYLDLDGGSILGGKMWRVTPMVNWYMSRYLRLELAYGYGVLDRIEMSGSTHFFQSRIQLFIN